MKSCGVAERLETAGRVEEWIRMLLWILRRCLAIHNSREHAQVASDSRLLSAQAEDCLSLVGRGHIDMYTGRNVSVIDDGVGVRKTLEIYR